MTTSADPLAVTRDHLQAALVGTRSHPEAACAELERASEALTDDGPLVADSAEGRALAHIDTAREHAAGGAGGREARFHIRQAQQLLVLAQEEGE